MSIWIDKPDLITLIHDSNGSFSVMGARLTQLDKWNKIYAKERTEKGENADSTPFIIAEYFRSEIKRLKGIIDYFYSKEKAKYEQEVKDRVGNTN